MKGRRAQREHSPPDPWGRDTAKQNATADSSPEDHTECGPMRAPAQGRQREEQAGPPPGKKQKERVGRGGGERTAHSHQTARQHHKRRPNPPPRRHRRQDPQRGTGGPPSQNRQHQARNSGPAGKGTPKHADTHHAGIKKKSQQPSPKKGDGGTGTTRPGTGTASNRHHKAKPRHAQKKSAKNTPRQPNQERRGTVEPRAQHARPHTAPQPGKAGNKRGARTNTHPRTATPTRRCRRPRGAGGRAHTHPNTPPRRGGAQPKPKPQHACPHRTPEPETAGCRRSAHATTHVPYAGRNLSPTTNTTNSRQKRDNTTNRTQTHPPKTPVGTGGVN